MTEDSKLGCGCATMIVLIIGVYCVIHQWCPGLDFMQMSFFAWVPSLIIIACVHTFFEEKIPTTKSKRQIEDERRREEERQREEERRRQQTLREEQERKERERRERERRERMERDRCEREKQEEALRRERERIQSQERFLRYMFSMLAKLAKADGRVDREEVEVMEKVFSRFDFAERRRKFCAGVFNSAKDNNRSIYWYAEQFGQQATDDEVCLFLYEVLWDVACADGWLHPAEKDILLRICPYLHVSEAYYHINYRRRIGSFKEGDKRASSRSNHKSEERTRRSRDWRRPYVSGKSSILEAYEILECESTDSVDTLRTAYRKVAKRYHPDLLRANGVPDEMIAEATTRMAQVNAAWEDIRRARNIS